MALSSVIDTSNRVPGSYVEVQFGVGGSSAGDAPRRVLVVGHMTSAGTWTPNEPVPVFSADDAKAGGGQGSEIARMVAAAFKAYRGATIYACPLSAPGGGTAASGGINVTGTATEAGTIVLYVGGERIEVAVASGDTAAVVIVSIETAVNDLPDLPVTAADDGVDDVVLTARTAGTRGNNISFRSSGAIAGLTITHASGHLSSGAGSDSLTAAQAALDPERYHLIAVAHDDATSIQSWRSHVNDNAAPTEGRRQQVVAATKDTLANAITLATSINAQRVQVCWHYNADDPPSEVAAAVAARRAELEARDPAAPMSQPHGTTVSGLRPQPVVADRPISTELKSALDNGITPISLDAAGNAYICRSITSRSQDTAGAPNYATLDTSKVTVPDFIADDLVTWWAGFVLTAGKLAPDDPDGNAPPPGVATPATIKDGIYGRLKSWEPELIVNVDAQLPSLIVEIAESPDGRVNALVPTDVVEGAYQLAAGVQQTG